MYTKYSLSASTAESSVSACENLQKIKGELGLPKKYERMPQSTVTYT